VEYSDGSAEERLLADVALERELELVIRVAELERNRWAAFSLVELEWVTNAQLADGDASRWEPETLPAEADTELARRARADAESV
jgi:hypothetical protein